VYIFFLYGAVALHGMAFWWAKLPDNSEHEKLYLYYLGDDILEEK